MLTPQGSTRAQIDLAYIRERAMQHSAEDEDDVSYDGETPCKRQCSSYLRSSDLPREYFQPSPQVPPSPPSIPPPPVCALQCLDAKQNAEIKILYGHRI